MTRLFFSNTANQLNLAAGVVGTDTTLQFSGTPTGWPVTPCKAVIDPDTASAEVVKITAIGSSFFTVVRGQDGTSAQNHSSGAVVEHRYGAAEADEANSHVNSSTVVHGVAGAVVGTTDAQVLTNKTLTSPVMDTATARASTSAPGLGVKAAASGTANIQEWQDSAGVRLTRVGQHGDLLIQPNDPTVTPLLIRGATGQSADLVNINDEGAVKRLAVSPQGALVLWPNSYPGLKIIPKDNTQSDLVLFRNSADTANKARVDSFGNIEGAAFVADGNGTADAFQFPSGGAKFKVDSNGNLVIAGSLTADTVVADDVVRRVGRNADGSGPSAGATEVVGNSHGYPVVNGRRYNVRVLVTTTAGSGVTIRQVTARVSSGAVTNASQLIESMQRSYAGGNASRDDLYFDGDFTASSTGTWNVALGVSTQGGAGNTNITTSVVTVYDVGI